MTASASETLLARLGLTPDVAGDPATQRWSDPGRWGKLAPTVTEDLLRVAALPRRPVPSLEEQRRLARVLTECLALPPGPCECAALRPAVARPCIRELLPVQGWYLSEAAQVGGVLGHVVAGGGKTGIAVLLPSVIQEVEPSTEVRAVLLIPPQLRAQFALDFRCWSQHFRVPNLAGSSPPFAPQRPTLHVVAYSELSNKRWARALSAMRPTIVIADEGQALARRESTRTHRLLSHFCENEGIRFFVHSGTLTTRALEDYAHLSALALREGSPLPIDPHVTEEWGGVIDASDDPAPIGALARLCEVGEKARSGFRKRLTETAGVVVTEDARLPCRLRIVERRVSEVPAAVREALAFVRSESQRPDGEELVEASEVATSCRQIACGFYYRWKYPRGESLELIEEWFERRQAWFRALRDRLRFRTPYMDSPSFCEDAAKRALERAALAPAARAAWDLAEGHGDVRRGDLPRWDEPTYAPWVEIAREVRPEQDAVWIDDFLARDAVEWAREAPGIVWYAHGAFGRRVAQLGGLRLYGGGADASEQIQLERGDRSIVASIKAHGTGKNLQAFCRALIANSPDRGGWEQLLARCHREGQAAPVVENSVYRHTGEVCEAFEAGRDGARYVHETTGQPERILYADVSWEAPPPAE